MKYLKSICPPYSKILDACAGTGIYAFPLAELGHSVTAGDLVDSNVEQIKNKQKISPLLKEIYIGDIMDLSSFSDNSLDVVLNFGAFYHLIHEEDRNRALQESLRVLKPEGIYCLSYINKFANYIKFNKQMKDDFSIFEVYIKKGYHDGSEIFYASTPEDIEILMYKFGLQKIHKIATDGIKFVMRDTVNSFSDEEFDRWLNIHYQTCEVKSLLGYSEHGLYIGRKSAGS